MESPGASRIAAEEAWESEAAPESEMAPESEVAPALPESEMAPEPEERPSMLSRLASWRAPEPEPEMEREGETEAPAPPQDEPRQLPCDHHHCRAPPGRLGLAFKDSTRVVGRVNATSALSDTVREGDELPAVVERELEPHGAAQRHLELARVEAAVGHLEPLRDASFRERGRRARAEPAFWARERSEPC